MDSRDSLNTFNFCASLWLRGERGCDGSHSRAGSEGYPGTWIFEQKKLRAGLGRHRNRCLRLL